jgi:hypothetical protein
MKGNASAVFLLPHLNTISDGATAPLEACRIRRKNNSVNIAARSRKVD